MSTKHTTVFLFCWSSRSTDHYQILTVILWRHSWEVFIPEAVVRLPVTKPYVAVPVNLQVREVVQVERLPCHVSSNIRSRISVRNTHIVIISLVLINLHYTKMLEGLLVDASSWQSKRSSSGCCWLGFFMCRFPGTRGRAGSDAQCGHSDCHHSIMHRHIAPITAI